MRKHSTRKPRPVRIPVTRGLLDDFGRELHYSLMKAKVGHFSTVEFDKIGGCINVVYGALDLKPPRDKTLLVAIERAKAVSEVSQTIINSVKAEIDFARVTGRNSTSGFIPVAELPKPKHIGALPGEGNPRITHPAPGVTRHTCE